MQGGREKSQRLDEDGVQLEHGLEMGLALFLDRAEEREHGWHRRLHRVRPGE
jgi:hypothetical protein